MYSFQPIADMSQSHFGFYMMCVVVIFAVALTLADYFETGSFDVAAVVACMLLTLVLGLTAVVSFTDEPTKNEVVIGTLLDSTSVQREEKSGKTYTTRDYMVVKYVVPEGVVSLQARYGAVYPDRAILYKN